jgi:hypothetical protein
MRGYSCPFAAGQVAEPISFQQRDDVFFSHDP